MGCISTIKHNNFPKQGSYLNKKVMVCFHYDTENQITGEVIRDDAENPWVTMIKLENGEYYTNYRMSV